MTANPQKLPSIIHTAAGAVYVDGQQYPLPEQVVKNIETVISFQAKQENQVPIHERILEKIGDFLCKPQFLYAQLLFFGGWWVFSKFFADLCPFPVLRFDLHEMGVDVAALLIATGVLIRQSRQNKMSEQRSHLMLQINLLTEQKIAKLIELIEELRTDLPIVQDRYDLETEAMKRATDPQVLLNILQENLEQASAEQTALEASEDPSEDQKVQRAASEPEASEDQQAQKTAVRPTAAD